MRQEWKCTTLDEACEITYGTRVIKKHDAGTIYPVYGGGGETFRIDRFNREDCTIVSRFGMSEACVRHVRGRFFLNDSGLSVGTKNSNELCTRFLDYFLYASQRSIYSLGRGSAQKNLDVPNFRKLKIHYPKNLHEQKRIVAILDEAFAGIETAIANTEKNLTNARELFETYLATVASDEKPLGEYVQIATGKLNANAAVENGRYPFFTCSRQAFQTDEYAFDCEAILLAGNNASGDFNVKHYLGKFNAYQRTYVIRVNDENKLIYRFLYYQMLRGLKQLKKGSVGAGTKFLKLGMIKNLPISLPSIARQREVADMLDSLDRDVLRIMSIYQQKLTALTELKHSLLQKAFSGELTVDRAEREVESAVV